MDAAVIEVSHVSCKVGYRYLLHDINWRVGAGERWVVFGMNGSGKTTLLSIIAGFKQHTAGDVRLFEQAVSDDNILALRKRIGGFPAHFLTSTIPENRPWILCSRPSPARWG